MRRLDWILAGIVAAFLIAVAVLEIDSWSLASLGDVGARGAPIVDVALKRLVSRIPAPPLLGGDPS